MSRRDRRVVLHYSGYTRDDSGVHAVIRQLAGALPERTILGVQAGFVSEKKPPLRAWLGPGIEADVINLPNAWRALRVACRVRRWLNRSPHRIFHGHTRAGLLVALWLRLLGAKQVAVTVHVYGRKAWFYRLARRCLGSRLVWLTPAMKRHYGLKDTSWSGCIPNGLGSPWAPEYRHFAGGRSLRIGAAGMMVPWKRWDLVLAALAALPPGCVVEFFHIGGAVDSPDSREYEAKLQAMSRDPALAGRVHWLGWQDSSAALLQKVDAVIVPSDGEPFSMIALEALFAGVPVIATRGGGPEDFIVDGQNGWLVPAGDSAALAVRLARCCDEKEWRGLRQDPDQIHRFSLPATLAARWSEFYAALLLTN